MLGLYLFANLSLSVASAWHTSPECWPAPRYSHDTAPVELLDRVSLSAVEIAQPLSGTRSPNGGYQFALESAPGASLLRIDVEQGRQWLLRLQGSAWAPEVRWVNEKLLFLRVHWGRVVASDLLIDVEHGEILLHEQASEGSIAFEQYRQGCAGRCPCDEQEQAIADSEPSSSTQLLGLLEIPGVGEGSEKLPASIKVRQQPDRAAAVLALSQMSDFATRELSYEQPALVVYQRQSGWYQVALADAKRGWVESTELGQFHPLELLLPSRFSYLSRAWDGRLWSSPAAPRSDTAAADPSGETTVNVISAARPEGQLWLQLEVFDQSPCHGEEPSIVRRGWVPAHQADGEPLVWFYSRGC